MRANVPYLNPQLLRSRIGKICVAIIGSTAAEMLEKANAAVKENPFLEFRLDYLEKPLLALPKLKISGASRQLQKISHSRGHGATTPR